ncbi:MAG: hypothetical protein IJJ40_03755 [Clostridia bacterium]|nr:hypothetical protein [Clostridia bacterium]
MKNLKLCDTTIKNANGECGYSLSFREKIELAKMLDKLGVDVIEMGVPQSLRTDGLLIKSIAAAVENATVSVAIPIESEKDAEYIWECLKDAKNKRLQVSLPVSTVQMEYLYHKKSDGMIELVKEKVSLAKRFTDNVEFCAEDATRADFDFLLDVISAAKDSGATVFTLCDAAGEMLPEEFSSLVKNVKEKLGEVNIGVLVSDNLYMAQSCAVNAISAGADEIKVCAVKGNTAALEQVAFAVNAVSDKLSVKTGVKITELHRTAAKIERLCRTDRPKSSPFDNGVREEEDFTLSVHDEKSQIAAAASKLGYDLSGEDIDIVYEAFLSVADKKEQITAKELDVLIATSALQVPPTYKLEGYVINSGDIITSTSQIRLSKDEKTLEGFAAGDGPVDSSFLAIEQITGMHYELDDFQIRAVTEGREAMGESVVRLRSNGKLYSGRGICTNIVGSSIMAYINALNKIVYEEN